MNRNLEELEGEVWEEPVDPTPLEEKCHRLRKKPIADFTIEDLRLMIGQQIGLRYLMPLALDLLEEDPLAAGDFYPGDLLMNVMRVAPLFWSEAPGLLARALVVARSAKPRLDERDHAVAVAFLERHGS